DGPGGAGQAGEDVWGGVRRCRGRKRVIASFSDYAASGGYYIAMGADSIVSAPATITGSIGIYGGKMNVRGLLAKLGVDVQTVSRGAHAEMVSPVRGFQPDEAPRFGGQ